jgi:hypothetical protein
MQAKWRDIGDDFWSRRAEPEKASCGPPYMLFEEAIFSGR